MDGGMDGWMDGRKRACMYTYAHLLRICYTACVSAIVCFACLLAGRGEDMLNANEPDLVSKTMSSCLQLLDLEFPRTRC